MSSDWSDSDDDPFVNEQLDDMAQKLADIQAENERLHQQVGRLDAETLRFRQQALGLNGIIAAREIQLKKLASRKSM
jgi:cell division septum initiation protein DivIVA